MTKGTEDNFTYYLMTVNGYAITRAVDMEVGIGYYHIIDPSKIGVDEPAIVKQNFHLGSFRHSTLEGIMRELREVVEIENGGARFGALFKGPGEL